LPEGLYFDETVGDVFGDGENIQLNSASSIPVSAFQYSSVHNPNTLEPISSDNTTTIDSEASTRARNHRRNIN